MATTKTSMKGVGKGNNPTSKKNLQPCKTKAEARKRGAAGGKKSQAVQKAKRNAREAARDILMNCTVNEQGVRMLKRKGLNLEDADTLQNAYALMYGLFAEGMSGNANCAKLFLEMAGELMDDAAKNDEEENNGVIMIAPVLDKEQGRG